LPGPVIISLDSALLRNSSSQPGSLGRAVLQLRLATETLPYLALLRVGFALPALSPGPRCALTAPFHPYPALQPLRAAPRGGMFSVALSLGSPPVGVTDHPALRSPDFPLPSSRDENSDHPALSGVS